MAIRTRNSSIKFGGYVAQPPTKKSAAETKKFQSRADFFNAMAHGAEKSEGGTLRKNYQATTKPENFSTFINLIQAVE
jgi:hypothetical protein